MQCCAVATTSGAIKSLAKTQAADNPNRISHLAVRAATLHDFELGRVSRSKGLLVNCESQIIHPLKELQDDQVVNALMQVTTLAVTFGTTLVADSCSERPMRNQRATTLS